MDTKTIQKCKKCSIDKFYRNSLKSYKDKKNTIIKHRNFFEHNFDNFFLFLNLAVIYQFYNTII